MEAHRYSLLLEGCRRCSERHNQNIALFLPFKETNGWHQALQQRLQTLLSGIDAIHTIRPFVNKKSLHKAAKSSRSKPSYLSSDRDSQI